MKHKIILIVAVLSSAVAAFNAHSYQNKSSILEKADMNEEFVDVTHLISPQEFEHIKQFTLLHGELITYRNLDSDNPSYYFKLGRVNTIAQYSEKVICLK